MTYTPKIILAGGSGFLGRTLTAFFAAKGTEVVSLSRGNKPVPNARTVAWDGKTIGPWTEELENAAAVINLAGLSVNCRYHEKNRREILDSRLDSTRTLGAGIRPLKSPPRVWLNSSTATIYRHTFGSPHGEAGDIGATPDAKDAFSVEVATAWERAFFSEAETPPEVRKIALRTGLVIGTELGGVYEVLRRLARTGLGGRMASGRQFVSWIHALDFCRAVDWLIRQPAADGIYNLTSPTPVTNASMMTDLRRQVGAPFGLPAPAFLLEIGAFLLRTETELIIKSRRVIPERLLKEGFSFFFPTVPEAIADLEHQPN